MFAATDDVDLLAHILRAMLSVIDYYMPRSERFPSIGVVRQSLATALAEVEASKEATPDE